MDNKLFSELLDGVNEMVAIENGEMQPHADRLHHHTIPDVKLMRTRLGMKQQEFAQAIGASAALVQSWELKRRIPTGIALKLLRLLEREPKLIEALKLV